VKMLKIAAVVVCLACFSAADDQIPAAAWTRPLGQPLEGAGGHKPQIQGMIDDGYWQGAPVGGFGAGTFSRSYRGDFERWHLKTGTHKYQNVPANQFSVFVQSGTNKYAQVLSNSKSQGMLSAWKWEYPVGGGEYAALYPKSWFHYKTAEMPVELTVEQFSPVLPNNYKDSSYPVAIYNWYASNPTSAPVTVSVMFSWSNMVGWLRDAGPDFKAANSTQDINHARTETVAGVGSMSGIVFDRLRQGAVKDEWDGQFAIATAPGQDMQVTSRSTFVPFGDGSEIWSTFSNDGTLQANPEEYASAGEPLAGAIAVKFTLQPGEKKSFPMVLAWDLPVVQFGNGRKWLRRYTDFYGAEGTHAWQIAADALRNDQAWSKQIDAWQAPYVKDENKPAWYRGMLFNELYILADGGTLWGRKQEGPRPAGPNDYQNQAFSFLECFDYPYYGTLDVRFYGSMPLAKFWPELDKMEMREFAVTINQQIPWKYAWLWKSQQDHALVLKQRKVLGAVPHDLGVPAEDPVVLVNQFTWQNTNRWKDLNSKYVLMVWRDYVLSGRKDIAFLKESYAPAKQALDYLKQFDKNGDGLIENEGYPDQTYDTWVTRGASAYSGGLYLAALRAMQEMAKVMGDAKTAADYGALFAKAQQSYVKLLWNGSYFNYDQESPYHDNIMADQLAGQWYANLTGLGDIVPKEMRVSALKKVFDYNVMKYAGGEMGALNGMGADGKVLTDNEQIQEVWTGTTFGLASEMLAEGLRDEAFHTAKGIWNVVYDKKGYWFRTPEAWDTEGMYRASMYMRPAAIWAMEMVGPDATAPVPHASQKTPQAKKPKH
jgi:non-lysosomal glucosylceramidase